MQIEINRSTLNRSHQKVFAEHRSLVTSLPGAVHGRVPVPSVEWSAPTRPQSLKLQGILGVQRRSIELRFERAQPGGLLEGSAIHIETCRTSRR